MLIAKKCTIVVGAGCSADYGIPLGKELLEKATHCVAKLSQRVSEQLPDDAPITNYFDPGNPPQLQRLLVALGSIPNTLPRDLRNIAELFETAHTQTIDQFALEFPQFSNVAKLLTADILIDEITTDQQSSKPHPKLLNRVIRRGDNSLDNWAHKLVSVVRASIRKHRPRSQRLNIVSFNYDGVLEYIVRDIWRKARENIGDLEEFVTFLYPHGRFILTGPEQSRQSYIDQCVASIKYSWEEEKADHALSARAEIEKSEVVYVLGFACAPENIQTLGLSEFKGLLRGQNFGGQIGLYHRLKELGAKHEDIWEGALPKVIDDGFLGEMPA